MSATSDDSLELPDTPAGRQAAWFIHHSNTRGAELTVEEIAQHMWFPAPWSPEGGLERFKQDDFPRQITRVDAVSPYAVTVRIADDDERFKPVIVTFNVKEEPPHRIFRLDVVRDVGESVIIREARVDEGPVLRQLEIRSPLKIGNATITYDRGDDFFAFARLMEETVNFVAEEHGELLALHCVALHPVLIGGKPYQAMLLHHLRIPPENQRRGLFSPLNVRGFQTSEGRQNAPYGYFAVDNAAAERLHGPDRWSFQAMRGVLRCEDLAGPSIGRAATPDDAERIVEILNRCHSGEEMYVSHTVDSLAARLERAPDLYSWDRVWITERAVAGVWPAGLKVTREEGGSRTENVRASALDHGFLPGAEGEFESLVRAWCGWLAERGTTELAIYTSEGSKNYGVVSRLAVQMDRYVLRMGVPEPEGAAQRGMYIDAVYF